MNIDMEGNFYVTEFVRIENIKDIISNNRHAYGSFT